MFKRIRGMLESIVAARSAKRQVRRSFAEAFPRRKITRMSLIARPEGGFVFRVFYAADWTPPPSKVIEMKSDPPAIGEVDLSKHPEYCIPNYR